VRRVRRPTAITQLTADADAKGDRTLTPSPYQSDGDWPMTPPTGSSHAAHGVIVAAAFVIVVAGIQAAASIVAPFLLAVFIAVVATPPLRWLRRFGAPRWGALLIVVFILLDLGSLVALVATGALEGFRDSLPTYQERLVLLTDELGGWLEGLGMPNSRAAMPDIFDPGQAMDLTRKLLSNVTGIIGNGLLVLLTVVFILSEASGLPAKLRAAFKTTAETEARQTQVLAAINRYMVIKTLTSLATALLIWVWLWFLGLDFAVLWALLAFFLNFVPFVGSILMAVPAVLLALVQTDLQTTMLVGLGYLVVNTVIGSILEPRIMGRGLGISALAVFLSLLFWGWVLGSVGVFLSIPLTMALMIALDASPQTRPMAILLGPNLSEATPIGADGTATARPVQSLPAQDRTETQ
jgi:AI-2 transport protein TqsA